jgi:large subunit ribosomal protein L16
MKSSKVIINNIKQLKQQKKRLKGYIFTQNLKILQKGFFGIQSIENGYINQKQIEAFRRNLIRKSIRKIKIFKKFNLIKSITFKPIESRMGKGKGKYSHSVGIIRKGQLLFEILNVIYNTDIILELLLSAKKKLPMKTKIIFFKTIVK